MTDQNYVSIFELGACEEITKNILGAIDKAPNRDELSGSVLIAAEIAKELGVTDRGVERPSYRDMLGAPPSKNPAAVY
mgnify:CR=1 FL=1